MIQYIVFRVLILKSVRAKIYYVTTMFFELIFDIDARNSFRSSATTQEHLAKASRWKSSALVSPSSLRG